MGGGGGHNPHRGGVVKHMQNTIYHLQFWPMERVSMEEHYQVLYYTKKKVQNLGTAGDNVTIQGRIIFIYFGIVQQSSPIGQRW